jgi:dTDP-4-amino-4,6-dideoxygalactose transaminase
MGQAEAEAAARVINSGSIFRVKSTYREADNFERELCDQFRVKHCLLISSGTGALTAGLAALGVGPGDEVIVPAYTFMSTATAVLSVGAIPVLCDIDESMTMDPDDLLRKISKHTKAVMPVHMMGQPCGMDRIMDIAKKHGLYVVEDSCQADGGSYKGKRTGTIGDCGAYSFNAFKIISAGEGGALVTNNTALYERAVIYHDCGTPFWTDNISEPLFTGTTYRVSEITGAVMRVQLTRLDGILADLRRVRNTILDGCKGLGLRTARSNDIEGDCGLIIPFQFDDLNTAVKFEKLVGGGRPVNTGKHVYNNWTPILEKRGAATESLNPYNHPENQGLNMDWTVDSCLQSLDVLSRTVYFNLHCDWDEAVINEKIELIRKAAAEL